MPVSRPFVSTFGVTKASAPASGNKKEEAKAARVILQEPESGNVLLEKNADQPVPPGTFACLMNQEVVFDTLAQGRINLDDQFEVSENAWRKGGAPGRCSARARVWARPKPLAVGKAMWDSSVRAA
jgi:serine-type D-Ala-D-Ala carboxypeptidase (penicillin-binding protein 5/6)